LFLCFAFTPLQWITPYIITQPQCTTQNITAAKTMKGTLERECRRNSLITMSCNEHTYFTIITPLQWLHCSENDQGYIGARVGWNVQIRRQWRWSYHCNELNHLIIIQPQCTTAKTIKGTLEPEWGETFKFDVKDANGEELKLALFDWDRIGKNQVSSMQCHVTSFRVTPQRV
jgi:hypothetical protein